MTFQLLNLESLTNFEISYTVCPINPVHVYIVSRHIKCSGLLGNTLHNTFHVKTLNNNQPYLFNILNMLFTRYYSITLASVCLQIKNTNFKSDSIIKALK